MNQNAHKERVGLALQEIRRMMEESGLSERKIAERAGLSRGYVAQLLTGKPELKIWHLLAVLDVLRCNPGDFFRKVYGAPRSALAEIKNSPKSPRMPELDDWFVQPVREIKARLKAVETALGRLPIAGRKTERRPSRPQTLRAMTSRRADSHGQQPVRWPDLGTVDCRLVEVWIPVDLVRRMDRALSLRPEGEAECTRRDLVLTAVEDWLKQYGDRALPGSRAIP